MKIYKMRNEDGSKVSLKLLTEIVDLLTSEIRAAGYLVDIELVGKSGIKLSRHGASFHVDVAKLGYNARFSPYYAGKIKKGWKRTNTPTWKQRVDFNNIVNEVLTYFNVQAKVVSGAFTIRDGFIQFTEDDWHNQIPEYIRHNEANGHVVTELPRESQVSNAAI